MTQRLKAHFLLDPDVTYLNHGAYGATPRPVFERHVQWQYELEREPVDFLSRLFTEQLAHARAVLADYVHTERDNLVYVSNGTTSINIIARSIPFGPGEELLTTRRDRAAVALHGAEARLRHRAAPGAAAGEHACTVRRRFLGGRDAANARDPDQPADVADRAGVSGRRDLRARAAF